jgi:hypothetical protein
MAMNRTRFLNKKVCGALVLLLMVVTAALVWIERMPLLASFYVHQLAKADEADNGVWVDRVAGLGEAALNDLLDCMNEPAPACCANARAALEKLTGEWGANDPRTLALAHRCCREFQHMSPAGQRNVLELAGGWFASGANDQAPTAGLLPPSSRLLAEAVASREPEVQDSALRLCVILVRQAQGNEALSSARELVRACLGSEDAKVRARAVHMTVQPGMDLSEQVVPLLGDPVAEVRRAAILAVSLDDAVLADDLLPSLHDSDVEVRTQCETILSNRGLTSQEIKLGWLLYHSDPLERIKVIKLLHDSPRLDPGVWLERLSRDASPAIRIAAVRVMIEEVISPPRERIIEMAQSDPSESVAWAARWYLERLPPH